jgi:tetrahydromethanopterin S-methyltransferase subunit G
MKLLQEGEDDRMIRMEKQLMDRIDKLEEKLDFISRHLAAKF